jgi:hypothetical protein
MEGAKGIPTFFRHSKPLLKIAHSEVIRAGNTAITLFKSAALPGVIPLEIMVH